MSDERLRYGRFYTPGGLVDLVTALAVQGPEDRIWDPTCGDGAFLRGAERRGHRRELLRGTDIDGAAVEGAAGSLAGAGLQQADLFTLDPGGPMPGRVDAVVGNPPFVRTERLPPARRAWLTERMSAVIGEALPARLDLAALATLQAIRFLRPGGRLAFVLPNTLLDAEAAAAFRRLLTERTRLVAVVESEDEPWFAEVALNTVVVVVQARIEATEPDPLPVFARLSAPPAGRWAEGILLGRSEPGLSVRRAEAGAERWTVPLRAPDVFVETARGPGFRPLSGDGGLLDLGYGTKVGVTAFFAPHPDALSAVEPRFVRPFLRTLKGLDRYEVARADVAGRVFDCSTDPGGAADPTLSPGAAAWIEAGEHGRNRNGTRWPEVPSVRGHSPWYALPELRTGPILLPQFRSERHAIHGNPDGIPVNNSAWWGRPREAVDLASMLGLLNSSWLALAAEVLGRTNLGEGLLTLYGPDLAALPVPAPEWTGGDGAAELGEAWNRLRRRPILPFPEEVRQPDRRALDSAVARLLGRDEAWAAAVREGAVLLMGRRSRRADRRRRTRREA